MGEEEEDITNEGEDSTGEGGGARGNGRRGRVSVSFQRGFNALLKVYHTTGRPRDGAETSASTRSIPAHGPNRQGQHREVPFYSHT